MQRELRYRGETGQYLGQVIKINITHEGQMDILCLQIRHITVLVFWPGIHNLNLLMNKYWGKKTKLRKSLQNNWSVFCRNITVTKDKERAKKYCRLGDLMRHGN